MSVAIRHNIRWNVENAEKARNAALSMINTQGDLEPVLAAAFGDATLTLADFEERIHWVISDTADVCSECGFWAHAEELHEPFGWQDDVYCEECVPPGYTTDYDEEEDDEED